MFYIRGKLFYQRTASIAYIPKLSDENRDTNPKIDIDHMTYIIEGTNMSSANKSGAIERMKKCFNTYTNLAIDYFKIFDLLEQQEIDGIIIFNRWYFNSFSGLLLII